MLDLSLPSGLRDLLPDHSAHLAELSARLQEVFSSFGYRRLFLPTLERLEVVERGLSPAALADVAEVRRAGLGRGGGHPARHHARRSPGSTRPAPTRCRRRPGSATTGRCCGPARRGPGVPREVYQAGVELLGAGGAAADAEALVVLSRALERVGLPARGRRGGPRPLRARR